MNVTNHNLMADDVLVKGILGKPAGLAPQDNASASSPLARTGSVQADAAPAAVNPLALAQLVGGDPATIVKFLKIFLASARNDVAELHAALGNRSTERIAAQAHKLKSAARAVGADALADLCEQLERAGKSADWAALDAASARLEPAFVAVERTIEAHASSRTAVAKNAGRSRSGGAHRALVLDDDEFMLTMLSRALESLAFDAIVTCASGADALSRFQPEAEWPDIVLCDLHMPEMDGVEFLRKLAEIGYDGGIVIISGADKRILGTVETLARGNRLQILGHLEKPVTPEQLKSILVRWLPGQELRPRASTRTCTADEIRAGLAQGQFVPWFQPAVEVVTGCVVAAEALLRWRHPEHGVIAPDCFLPVAEEGGLLRELTASIVTQSLRQAQAWHSEGIDIRLALNVSASDLVHFDFPEQLLQLAQGAGVKPYNITIEVTEGRLSGNALVSLDILARLHLKGIGLSIADFGTGHSGLARLRDFPFDELKIGQTFVRGADRDLAARDILESAIGLGKKFSMRVVAEGVETKEQWDLVTALGCDVVQGYFIAAPMPGPEVAAWITAWNSR